MTTQYHLTPKEYDMVMKDHFVILVDTAEKKNQHIISWFEANGINYREKALKTGDYSLLITKCEDVGVMQDWYLTDEVCIERKGSVDELAGNFSSSSKDNDRLLRELGKFDGTRNYVLIEDGNIEDIIDGKYRSKINGKGLFNALITLQSRSGFWPIFAKKERSGFIIYTLCKSAFDSHLVK